MTDHTSRAEQFAKALDREDYALAESLLAEDCEYFCRGERCYGPAAIIASYRENGDAAKLFDVVEYTSRVDLQSDGTCRLYFFDHLTQGSYAFTFCSEQVVAFDESGLITRIEHHDFPEQLERLEGFKKLLGNRDTLD